MPQPIPSVQYLFEIPPNLVAMWSARAIYTVKPEPFIDVLHDRQFMYGENQSQEAKELCAWLNKEGIKGLQVVCKRTGLYPDESRIVEYIGKGYIIRGNPNSSYGYLYIVAYRIPVESGKN